MMDKTNIWEHFDVKPQDPEDISVIGIDNGAGEMAGCVARFRYGKLTLHDLNVDNNNNKYLYTAYNDEHKILGEEALKYQGELYTNIKVTPENAVKKYGKKLEGGCSYQYLMGKSFSCFIQNLLNMKEIVGDTGGKEIKHIFLFVGRPSSNSWEKQSKEYQEILKQYLPDLESQAVEIDAQTEIRVKFHVIVYSEAEAAMANEYRRGNIGKDETIVVIDGGSSTFDCVVVRDGQVANEYSRQVGAGMIDKNMFDLFLLGEECAGLSVDERRAEHDKRVGDINDNEGNHTIKLRRKKEDFYGPNGDDGDDMNRYAILLTGNKIVKNIDDDFMKLAVEKMPVRVERSYVGEEDAFGGNRTRDYNSFQEAAEAFCRGAKARCQDKRTGEKLEINRIILTGGATVMPFLQKIIEEVFEVEKNHIKMEHPSKDRHYSVARGLAYMGYAELMKERELTRIRQELCRKIDDIKGDIAAQITNTCKEKIWEEFFVNKMAIWEKNIFLMTLNSWLDMGYRIPIDDVREDLSKLLAEKGVISKMNAALEEHFTQLFPKADSEYHYTIQEGDIVTAFSGNLKTITVYLQDLLGKGRMLANAFGLFGFRSIGWSTILTDDEKKKIQTHVKENKSKILEKLDSQITRETQEVVTRVYNTMIDNINQSLGDYMEELMPYFVREAADVQND